MGTGSPRRTAWGATTVNERESGRCGAAVTFGGRAGRRPHSAAPPQFLITGKARSEHRERSQLLLDLIQRAVHELRAA